MTTLLETAFKKVSELSEEEQNGYAKMLIDEIEAVARWHNTFESSSDMLEEMANEALNDYRDNRTTPIKAEQL